MMVDPSGYLPTWAKWTLGITIIAASVGLSIATAGLATPIASAVGGGLFGAVVGGATAGAIGGAIASFGVSVGAQGFLKDLIMLIGVKLERILQLVQVVV